jgi:hypothetical protein
MLPKAIETLCGNSALVAAYCNGMERDSSGLITRMKRPPDLALGEHNYVINIGDLRPHYRGGNARSSQRPYGFPPRDVPPSSAIEFKDGLNDRKPF